LNKKVLSLALTVALATTYMGSTVYASPYSDKAAQEQKLKESKIKYESAQEIVDEIEAQLQAIDSQIANIFVDIENTNNKISYTEKQIKISEEGVQAAENSIKEEENLFNMRMRAMYINGMDSYVETILNSKGLGDFISRLENVTKIINYDKEVVASLTEKKMALVQKKDVLQEEKTQLVVLQEENKKRVAELDVKKEEQRVAMAKAETNRDLYETVMNENKAQLAQTLAQIRSMEAASTPSRPSRGSNDDSVQVPVSGNGNAIVSYAAKFLGTPYKWGGNGPNSFDCSGFTSYVFRANGISLPRTANSQMNTGAYVSRNQLQPGDLVFFGSKGYATHVGIYVGNNSYIHSPRTGDVVKISPLTRKDFIQARRR
jgi:peptidoglycan DL-endopeptidase CwlO